MHGGSIDRPDTAAGRVYAALRDRNGGWVGGWDLSMIAQTTAVSTRVSEVRAQLARQPGRGECVEVERRGQKFFYRLVAEKGQMELIA